MSHRLLKPSDFRGKTIKSVDCRAVNFLRLRFTDGTTLAVEVDAVGLDVYGMVVCDECGNLNPKRPAKKR